MRYILSSNPYRDTKLRTALAAKEILEKHGGQTVICLPFDSISSDRFEAPQGVKIEPLEDQLSISDMLLCFGGDGTILHTARSAVKYDIPVLGINLGSVGFIAELERGEISCLPRLEEGKYTLEPRMLLDVRIFRGKKLIHQELALNDAVFSKCAVSRVADIEVYADGVQTTKITGDGVIVSTPTGSSAYSLSAGGPIVEPTGEQILITPICAHHFSARPMVLSSHRTVTVRIPRGSSKNIQLCIDGGRPIRLGREEWVELRCAEETVKLVRIYNRNFYQLLNKKLSGGIR